MTQAMTYKVDSEIYIAIVLTKSAFIHTFLDDTGMIERYFPLMNIFKSINESNIEEYKVKDTELETKLYNEIKRVSGKNSLGWTIELAICAFNVNLQIDALVLEHLLSERLIHSISGLKCYQLCDEIEKYFDADRVITRKTLDEFTNYILQRVT
ncbi:hypothetical protein [Listeria seeligeri]|uniref:hypothetical protein n=1 Tax=Listeria seeligeri TaxID=1640 RepID=UPI001624BF26|nr:hypothetical protein [Listeria seeligeri]MBC1824206.1 hypothetical protein [Listeria seeligeri]MBC1837860.1 hypothetical protein [Listeria seeligeri]